MTTANLNTQVASYRTDVPPPISSHHEEQRLADDQRLPWNLGAGNEDSSIDNIDHPGINMRNAIRNHLASLATDSSISLADMMADLNSAKAAAAQMNPGAQTPVSDNTTGTQAATALSPSCEAAYLNGCIAGSIALFCLSILSFVIPSISTYSEERTTVQGLGYTAGVIALISSLATAGCVVLVHTKCGEARN
ncbi:MAG: hypothetical protein FGM20_11020 [Burkholderiaceae bacterium]|jgi:hypothetical protein|nr:hypothetical protein [Burkholderiaceae bacterium]